MNAVWVVALGLILAVAPAVVAYVLLRAQLDDRDRRIATLRNSLTNVAGSLMAAEKERDGYADALAGVLGQAGRGDLEGVVAHANQALEGGDYHGRLRAAQDALEDREAATAREEADLLACSCADEMGQR